THTHNDNDQKLQQYSHVSYEYRVHLAPEKTGRDSHQTAEDEREQHGHEADLQIESRAERDAAPDVAPEVVGPEDVPRAQWGQERLGELLCDRVVGREERRGERDEGDEAEEPEAGQQRRVEPDLSRPHDRRDPCQLPDTEGLLTHR